jgi:cell division protein FtsL
MHAQPRPAVRRAPEPSPAPLRVVAPRRRLRTGPTVVLGGMLAFAIAFGLVVAQTELVQGQQELDRLDRRIADATREQQELRLQVAELESPARIAAAATRDLGMVPPAGVTYLTPSGAVTVSESTGPP